jgi:hypothetical protein
MTLRQTQMRVRLAGTVILGLIVGIVLLVHWEDDLGWLSAALGALIGWAAGILSAPYNTRESTQFRVYGKVASAFITGFLVAKIDRIFDLGIDEKHGPLILHERFARNLMVGACCFFIAMISTFIVRQYGAGEPEHERDLPGEDRLNV